MKDLSTTALIAYPLSQDYKRGLDELIDSPIVYVLLSDLKRQGLIGMLCTLRQIRGQLLLPLEDPASEALLPILRILALCTRSKNRLLITSNYSLKSVKILPSMLGLVHFCWASVSNQIALWRIKRYLSSANSRYEQREPSLHNRIVYLNTNLWFGIKAGGSVGHIAGVCNALVEKNYSVTYAAVEKNALLESRVNFSPLPTLRAYGLPYELNSYRFSMQLVQHLDAMFKESLPSMIYQRLSLNDMSGAMLAKRHGIPLIIEYNGSEAWIAKNWGKGLRYQTLAEQIEDVSLKQADFIVTISDVLKEELCQREIAPEKIIAYPNGIDTQRFNPSQYSDDIRLHMRRAHDIPVDAVVCTFLGTFGRWHGVDVLAQALLQLGQQSPDWFANNQVYFLFVGDGLQLPEIKASLDPSVVAPFCRFVGLVPQIEAPKFLAASDILLSPHKPNDDGSRFFGSPTKLFEYMAMAKAIIASDLEQVGEVLLPGIRAQHIKTNNIPNQCNAVLCEPGDPGDIITALKWLVDEPQWREQIGINARRKVLAQYTWQHHVDQILKPLLEQT